MIIITNQSSVKYIFAFAKYRNACWDCVLSHIEGCSILYKLLHIGTNRKIGENEWFWGKGCYWFIANYSYHLSASNNKKSDIPLMQWRYFLNKQKYREFWQLLFVYIYVFYGFNLTLLGQSILFCLILYSMCIT